MRSANLLSPGLVKSGLRRYWPLWLAGFIALLLFVVLPAYVSVPMIISGAENPADRDLALNFFWSAMSFSSWVYALGGALVVALTLNDHLFDSRAATFVGSLPLRRPTVFTSTFASGMLVLVALPAVAGLGLMPLCLMLGQVFSPLRVLEWFALTVALSFVFFSFAQLSCHVSGTRLVALLVYGVIGFLSICIEAAARLLMSGLVYGISSDEISFDWLAPAAHILSILTLHYPDRGIAWLELAPYLLVACVAMVGAAWLFGRRKLESAGDGGLFEPLREALKCLAGISLALLFASVYRLLDVTNAFNGIPVGTGELLALAVLFAIGGFLGVLFADMIMSRSTHVLGNCWREGLVVACVMLAFLGACRVDLLGVGRYVPKADEVETAILTCDYASDSIEIDSPEGIEDVRTLQQNLIAYGGEGDIDTEHAFTIDVTYRLKSGRYVHRTYPVLTNFPVTALGNTQDAQLLREFAQIADSDEGRASRFSEALGLKDNAHVQIEYMREDGTYSSVDLYGKDALDFIQSVLAHDLMEEGAGELFYEMTADESETTYDAVAYVEDQKRSQEEGYGSYLLSLQLSERTPNTLAWLEEHHPEVELIEVSYDG